MAVYTCCSQLEDVEDEKKNVNRVKAVVMENVDFVSFVAIVSLENGFITGVYD